MLIYVLHSNTNVAFCYIRIPTNIFIQIQLEKQ